MTANTQGNCYSVLSDYKPSVGCFRSAPDGAVGTITTGITYFGSSTTAALITIAPSHPVTLMSTTTVSAADYVGVSIMAMAILIHKPEDLSTGGNGPDKDPHANAAGSVRMGSGDRRSQWAFLVFLCTIAIGSVFVLSL